MAEAERFQKQHGFLPVNHTYIIRGDIYQKHPWVAFNLYNGFVRAKALAREKLLESIPSALFFGPEYLKRTQDIIGEDPFPYGIKANEAMLETITAYSYEQGLTPNKMNFKELFAENTLDF
jgi:4,5-dihydroxyphthalate decarboxylase